MQIIKEKESRNYKNEIQTPFNIFFKNVHLACTSWNHLNKIYQKKKKKKKKKKEKNK